MSGPLRLARATGGYGGPPVLRALDLSVEAGRVTALCGPNGCGKSTALQALRGRLPLTEGEALIGARAVASMRPKALAREVAMLGQSPVPPEDVTLRDLVTLGRYAHRAAFAGLSAADHAAIDHALATTGTAHLAGRPLQALSGGQLQRAWIAMTVAQAAPMLLLDEPTNHLDMNHALSALTLVRSLSRGGGRAVAVVLHDLNLAARFADRIVLMREGRAVASGAPAEVLTPALLAEVFDTHCAVIEHPEGGPLVVPLVMG